MLNIDDNEYDDDFIIEPDTRSAAAGGSSSQSKPQLKNVPPAPTDATPMMFNMSNFITPDVIGQSRERPFSGGTTLDESVAVTLKRDLATIGDKLLSILWPLRLKKALSQVQFLSNRDVEDSIGVDGDDSVDYSSETMKKIRDWDLWGPLVINLGFSVIITYLQNRSIDSGSSSETFSAAFTLIWLSLSILSVNIQLLSPVKQKLDNNQVSNGIIGLSFFQCVSLLSYSMFPITLGGIVSIFIKFKLIRMFVNLIFLCWSMLCISLILGIVTNCKQKGTASLPFSFPTNFTAANVDDDVATVTTSDNSNSGEHGDNRIFLMIFPVFLVFSLFSWFTVIV